MSEPYLHATGVLPPYLVEKCQAALDGHREVITFERILHSPLNEGEQLLGGVLTHQCRQQMFKKNIRQVYFAGQRTQLKLTRSGAAQELLNQGHSIQAVGDAIGVTRQTLYDWKCKSKRGRGASAHVLEYELTEDATALRAGIEIVRKRIKKGRPRLTGLDNDAALERLAEALKTDVDKARRRAYAAAHAAEVLCKIDLED